MFEWFPSFCFSFSYYFPFLMALMALRTPLLTRYPAISRISSCEYFPNRDGLSCPQPVNAPFLAHGNMRVSPAVKLVTLEINTHLYSLFPSLYGGSSSYTCELPQPFQAKAVIESRVAIPWTISSLYRKIVFHTINMFFM